MMAAPLIAFRDVSKAYGRGEATIRALDRINLSIAAGEFVSIMGPSGSGKSTAMNIIGGLDIPSSGEYVFQGIPTSGFSRAQLTLLRRHMLGFVFQGFNLLARTSAVENVELPLVYRGMQHAERRRRALAALEQVGLRGREGHTSQELSGGQQQRVAIARAIVTDPAVLLADEPTGNLDTKTSVEIMDLITRLNRENGITVIMVTHEEDIAAYARRMLRFVDGHLVSDESHVKEQADVV
jgi:putative ABC transport system ATP-binding protein